MTAANTSLQQKFKTKCDEVEALTADKQQLAANLDSVKADKQQLETAVAAATQEKESLVQVNRVSDPFLNLYLISSAIR